MKIKTLVDNLKNYNVYLKVQEAVEDFLQKKGYLKIDLPVLSPSLIPESYLEIFETEFNYFDKKEKFYLTPSSELFLKRLLVAGIGSCYYLGKSFRNSEPNSPFHTPEFTMLEYYKVGVNYLTFAEEVLTMMQFIARHLHKRDEILYQGKRISFKEWEKLTVAEAFKKFSNIEPKELFDPKAFLKRAAQKGYKTKGFTYQDVFSQMITQEVEPKLGKNRCPSLLYEYPKEMSSLAKLSSDGRTAKRAEFYIDGIEIGGFCEELNDWREQKKRFTDQSKKRKNLDLIQHAIDKGFIEALQYGLPDVTSGAGIGFERMAMIFANTTSIDQLKLIAIN